MQQPLKWLGVADQSLLKKRKKWYHCNPLAGLALEEGNESCVETSLSRRVCYAYAGWYKVEPSFETGDAGKTPALRSYWKISSSLKGAGGGDCNKLCWGVRADRPLWWIPVSMTHHCKLASNSNGQIDSIAVWEQQDKEASLGLLSHFI